MIKKVDELVEKMTLDEKAHLVNGATFFGTYPVERLDIPRMQTLDGATGMNLEQVFGDMTEYENWSDAEERKEIDADTSKPVNIIGSTMLVDVIENYFEPEKLTDKEKVLYRWIKKHMDARLNGKDYAPGCYPPGILLGCTWKPEVIRKVGEALGMESCLYGVHFLLGPNVNILRDPRNGRLFEGYSEDPYLVTKLAPEIVKGIQSYGVSATVKHYAANSQETNRLDIDERITKRALEEIFLPGFCACVKEGGTKTIMNAYNKINGARCTENKWLLQDKLRDDFGFDGMVMSDWGAALDPAKALDGGTDLAMPGPANPKAIYEAVKNGEVSEEVLDRACKRILSVYSWILEHYRKEEVDALPIEAVLEKTDAAAYDAACEGIVLLKNDGSCPLAKRTKLAILGSGSKQMLECGSGSAGIDTSRHGDVKAEFARYFELVDTADAEYVVVIAVISGMEGNDRENLFLAREDLDILAKLKKQNKNVILVLNTCGPIDMREIETENVKTVFCTFLPGMAGAKALSDMIAGVVNPSGKLTITFPERLEDAPTYMNFPGEGYHVNYGEGIYIGYRYYDKKKIHPRYAFGHGLSYTSFACTLDHVTSDTEKITAKVTVTNTGDCVGSEVIQIYIHDPYSTLPKPEKELKAFEKVKLAPGEKKTIVFEIPTSKLASYDMDLEKFTVEEGYYDVIAATSSAEGDIFGTERIYLDIKSPYSYCVDTPLRVISAEEDLLKAADEAWEEQGWDVGIIRNNCQYSPQKSLREILIYVDKHLCSEEKQKAFIESFENKIKPIKKK